MAYFSNGTEGEIFENRWCSRCVNNAEGNCPIWCLHLLWNSAAVGNDADETAAASLNTLIPMRGLDPDKCSMFCKSDLLGLEEELQQAVLQTWAVAGKGDPAETEALTRLVRVAEKMVRKGE